MELEFVNLHWWGFIDGDSLFLTDIGFGLVCFVIAGLLGCLIWKQVGLVKVWREWRKVRDE